MSKHVITVLCLLAFCTTASARQEKIPVDGGTAIEIDRMGSSGGGLQVNASDGWEFEVLKSCTITALGVWDHQDDGLNTEIPVGLWDSKGNLLAKVTVPAGDSARKIKEFRYVSIDPLRLQSGANYVIAASYTPETKENVGGGGSGTTFFTDGALRWVQRRRIIKQANLTFPPEQKGSTARLPGGFGPNFLLQQQTKPRRYHRCYKFAEPHAYRVIDDPEREDGSHLISPDIFLTVFANKGGSLTKLLVNGEAFAVNDDALALAGKRVRELATDMKAKKDVFPLVRLNAPSWSSDEQLAKAVDKCIGKRLINPLESGAQRELRFSTSDPHTSHQFAEFPDRFLDRGAHVEDTWTGMLWQKDGSIAGKHNYYQAQAYADGLEIDGIGDWRVPNREEIATIFPAISAPFTGSRYTSKRCCSPPDEYASYWTSELDHGAKNYAYVFHWYASGGANNCFADRNWAYVRVVRNAEDEPESEGQ